MKNRSERTHTNERRIRVVSPTNRDASPKSVKPATRPNQPPALDLDANNSTTLGANYLTVFTDGGPPVAVVDTDVLITDSDDTTLTKATATLTNGDPLGS